ncbi:alpha/beta fold hydrolase [Nostoc sp. CHAB 5784]|uniref:alpha/beta fold hydrolase n=1 Tax=Nostoc mirabile TaxID=2907820 RepID=UPI001E4C7C06|nr:alpha/beta fold hydrolase [Nostoc mirabile]MCC5668439.1 alpha/beta fold hydrolase [Nostoc mirabile CHAB5784]
MQRRSFCKSMLGIGLGALTLKHGFAIGHDKTKTYVLVHGAWSGGWCWKRLTTLLRNSGHEVSSPTCTGVGERAHLNTKAVGLGIWIQDVVNHIEQEDFSEIILVGSGFGGVVITGVADRIPKRLRKLVYLDALVIHNGNSAFDQLPPDVVANRLRQVEKEGNGINIPVPSVESFGLKNLNDIQWVASKLKPQPVNTYMEKLSLKGSIGNELPKVYIDCTSPPFKPLIEVKRRIKTEKDWDWRSINTSHDAMISAPKLVQEILQEL